MALADILEQNAFSPGGITPAGLARLRQRMLAAGHVSKLRLNALKGERAPVLAGGLAIMSVAVAELRIDRIDAVGGALRLGVLYDLLGRTFDEDSRAVTVERFTERYSIDRAQASRVAKLAVSLFRRASAARDSRAEQLVEWAALLHELGMSVSHTGFHKHGAYILQNADMPGFSAGEQGRLALLVFGCRGRLEKIGRLARPRRGPRRAACATSRRALPPRAHDDRCAAHPDRNRATDPNRDFRALARRASADRLPARARACAMGRAGLPVEGRDGLGGTAGTRARVAAARRVSRSGCNANPRNRRTRQA